VTTPRDGPWLIVGLGNPGKKYERSRHNVGFMALDRWAARHHLEIERRREWAMTGEGEAIIGDAHRRVLLAKPRTFMNLSGDAVIEMVRRHGIPPARAFIVYDDMDLPLGKLRLREQGSAGGHNGVGSIIQRLGTQDFPRLRIGIGRPQETAGYEAIGHVLGEFALDERRVLDDALDRACDAIDAVLSKGMQAAMGAFN
jgi:PTH1 family peptidyl-tRNA hydrolase